ncbi:zincin [Macrolepiota fuliginosa MF-IS2]|uniref:Neutral protease 2 n=1 Tax=Macrolepiota fuliginosa MF-IS2 TaxID=1400762 RepID=A0A9P5X6K2_9AGAR|nr:zincin [Macrolepiota fuliginosa MF-IS2]
MFFRPLVALGFLSIALATPYRRSDDLTVSLTGPSRSISSIDDLKFTASVTNHGAETVKILKYATILDDKLPTRSFTVTKDGEDVKFTGIKMSVSLEKAGESAYVSISPGETITVNHDASHLFDFATAGPGKFTFSPVADFAISSNSAFSRISAASSNVEVEVTGDVAKREFPLIKRETFFCANATQTAFMNGSYIEAKSLASISSSYVSSKGASDPVYTAYFGANPTSQVITILNAVANENSSSRSMDCTDELEVCGPGIIAYTLLSTGDIYYCSIFFDEAPTNTLCTVTTVASRNARGGTTLHELTHATSGTKDVNYGCDTNQQLTDPQKISNADNYACFATQVYANTQC